jgi:hypothetical protein
MATVGDILESQFWGVSASVLGTYEALSYLTGKRLPTLSTFCARRQYRRAALALWTAGLALHVWRHQLEDAVA